MDMNINKMVPGCPWRYSQKIYLQVLSFSLFKDTFWFLNRFQPTIYDMLNLGCISCWEKIFVCSFSSSPEVSIIFFWVESPFFHWWCQATSLVGWDVSSSILWLFQFSQKWCTYKIEMIYDNMFAFVLIVFRKGAWQNIFQIWKNILKNRLAENVFGLFTTVSVSLIFLFLVLNQHPHFCQNYYKYFEHRSWRLFH